MLWIFEPLTGNGYQFWSGIGSDFGEITLVTAVIMLYRAHNCHIKGCWRIGKHPFQHYKLCKIHHPGVPETVTHAHIKKLHKDSKDAKMVM